MYSTLKILPGLKLTFLLIIFGVGGIYMLEHSAHMRRMQVTDPVSFIQTTGVNPAGPASQKKETRKSVLAFQGNHNPDPAESMQSCVKVNSLSDLRLHIEL